MQIPQPIVSVSAPVSLATAEPQLARLHALFEVTFARYQIQLLGGADEPRYVPASVDCAFNRLYFRENYLSSALHEIAHWCIAGEARKQLDDFGYWYNPDGRTAEQQAAFEAFEVKPQAVEWLFSVLCGQRFRLSVDNLHGDADADSSVFAAAVLQQVQTYLQDVAQMPVLVVEFCNALAREYGSVFPPALAAFSVESASAMTR